MRAIVIATLPLLMLATGATAADLGRPYMKAPMMAPVPASTWTGLYVGINAGGGWARVPADFSTTGPVFGSATNSLTGFAGGGQIGYNWQTGPLVLGAEADFQGASLDGSIATSCPAALCGIALSASYDQKVNWFGTARGRIGYAQDSWLIYATGGYAYAQLQTNASATAGANSASLSEDDFRDGWTAGGGIEVMLASHWSVKAEYLYMDYGSKTTSFAVTGLPTLSADTKLNMNVVRAGLNYRF